MTYSSISKIKKLHTMWVWKFNKSMIFLWKKKLCLIPEKIEGKCKRKKIEEKNLKLINYFYLLLQARFTCFNSSIWILNPENM